MSVTVWRIGTDTPDYVADDLTGEGARRSGGRWNASGTAMVYAAESRALACLETVVHLNAGGFPSNRYLVEVVIPDDVRAAAETLGPADLPVGWDAAPAGAVSIGAGTSWAASARSAVLIVPSVIVPEEHNVLINPAHPDARRITSRKLRKWLYDARLERRDQPGVPPRSSRRPSATNR